MKHVPSDIWLDIFEALDSLFVRDSAHATRFWDLRRTCRLFNELIEPFVVRRIGSKEGRKLTLLCRKPELRSKVRFVSVKCRQRKLGDDVESVFQELQRCLEMTPTDESSSDSDLRADLLDGLRNHYADAADAFALWLCPNLHEIELHAVTHHGLLRTRAFRQLQHSQMQKISFRITERDHSLSSEDYGYWLRHIFEFNHGRSTSRPGSNLSWPSEQPQPPSREPSLLTIPTATTFNLNTSMYITPVDLRILGAVFPNLRHLSLRIWSLHNSWSYISPEELCEGLRRYTNTLRSLTLASTDLPRNNKNMRARSVLPIASLAFLRQLSDLEISEMILFGYPKGEDTRFEQVLPSGLQELTVLEGDGTGFPSRSWARFEGYADWTREQCERLTTEEAFPDLRRVVLRRDPDPRRAVDSSFLWMREQYVPSGEEAV